MIKILYAMIDQHMDKSFVDDLVFAQGEYEIMLFHTKVCIDVDGVIDVYPEHTCIIYEPGQRVHYYGADEPLVYSWIRFDCDEKLYTDGFLPFGKPVLCTDYSWYKIYWQAVANENFWRYSSSESSIEHLMHIIFHRLHEYAYHENDTVHRPALQKLRNDIYAHPEREWSLDMMAEEVNLSIRSLQKLYKESFHVSCMNEVIESRVSQAKTLLIQTEDSVYNISILCGYNSVEHFSRQFRKKEHISPKKYRDQHRSDRIN